MNVMLFFIIIIVSSSSSFGFISHFCFVFFSSFQISHKVMKISLDCVNCVTYDKTWQVYKRKQGGPMEWAKIMESSSIIKWRRQISKATHSHSHARTKFKHNHSPFFLQKKHQHIHTTKRYHFYRQNFVWKLFFFSFCFSLIFWQFMR